MMDFTIAAKNLIEAVGGMVSEETIAGTIRVFEAIVEMQDLNWEHWITTKTNESLAVDNITCDCGCKIRIERQYDTVYVDTI